MKAAGSSKSWYLSIKLHGVNPSDNFFISSLKYNLYLTQFKISTESSMYSLLAIVATAATAKIISLAVHYSVLLYIYKHTIKFRTEFVLFGYAWNQP
jgi:hypothetical protein